MAPVEFSVQLTEKDIVSFYDEVRPYWRKITPIAYAAIVLGIGGVFVGPDWFPAAFAAIAGGSVLLVMLRVSKAVLVRQFRKNPSARQMVRYQFFDDHLTIASDVAKADLRWEAFQRMKETPSYVCLHLSPLAGYIIPLAQLTPSQGLQFREPVRLRVPAAKGLGGPRHSRT